MVGRRGRGEGEGVRGGKGERERVWEGVKKDVMGWGDGEG